MLNTIFEDITSISWEHILILVLSGFLCGICIALTHMKTSTYSKNFVYSLTLLPILVGVTIFMVNGNLGTSVAVLGAFSLIRFRSVPGNAKEITSVFFAMSIGIAMGMGYILFGILVTIVVCLLQIFLEQIHFGQSKNNYKILKISIPEDLDYQTIFDDIFDNHVKDYKIEQVKTTNMGSLFELTYRIKLKNNNNEKEFIDELRTRNGNLKIVLTHNLLESEL